MVGEIGYAVGHIRNNTLLKILHQRNILRMPEQSFTFDANHYDELRRYFAYIKITIKETGESYGLTATEFDRLRSAYDYGNGIGYRVAIKHWVPLGKQLPLMPLNDL